MELNCSKKLQGEPQCLWLLGTPAALKGDPLFLEKSLIKVPISSQLAEYFYSRNIDSVA